VNTNTATVSNNLVWAILATLFCCLPFGIVSIVHAAKVNSLVAAGNTAAAQDAADKAKKWAIWSAAAWLVLVIAYVLFFVLLGLGGAMSSAN